METESVLRAVKANGICGSHIDAVLGEQGMLNRIHQGERLHFGARFGVDQMQRVVLAVEDKLVLGFIYADGSAAAVTVFDRESDSFVEYVGEIFFGRDHGALVGYGQNIQNF